MTAHSQVDPDRTMDDIRQGQTGLREASGSSVKQNRRTGDGFFLFLFFFPFSFLSGPSILLPAKEKVSELSEITEHKRELDAVGPRTIQLMSTNLLDLFFFFFLFFCLGGPAFCMD